MDEAEVRLWVKANPERVNDVYRGRNTPLYDAVCFIGSPSLIKWLVKEKGADVNAVDENGLTLLHRADSLDILEALLDCGADPTMEARDGATALIYHVWGTDDIRIVPRLLQDPRVRATVNAQDENGYTALHFACGQVDDPRAPAAVQLLLQAGADMTLKNVRGETASSSLRSYYPTHPTALALVDQKKDAKMAALVIKTRRLVLAARRSHNAAAPSYLQSRVVRGQPLPSVALAPATGTNNKIKERRHQFRALLAFLVGMEGGAEGGGMPRDVFRVLLDMLMPTWDPLRRGVAGDGGQQQQ